MELAPLLSPGFQLCPDMEAAAAARYADIVATGKTIGWDDMRAYLKSRIAGQAVKWPQARKFSL